MTPQDERSDSRLQYPAAERPTLVLDGRSCEVIDVSERGLRYRLADDAEIAVGDQIAGLVQFRSGETIPVRGSAVRLSGREVGVRLEPGVPLRVIIAEQRYLRAQRRGTVD